MNTLKLLPIIGTSCLLSLSAHSATVIEYRFDSQTRPDGKTLFTDSSGNGYDLKFNAAIAQELYTSPFADEYPPDSTDNQNARNNTSNDIRSGTIQGGTIANWQTNNSFTLEGWVNVRTIVTNGGTEQSGILWALTSDVGGTNRFQLRYNSNLTVSAWWFSQGANNTTITSTETITLNEWTHLAYVYDGESAGKTLSLYINGELVASASGLNKALPGTLTTINQVGMNIGGSFDDFRFSNTALDVNELGYWSPLTPVPEPHSVALILSGCGIALIARRGMKKHTPLG